MPDRELGGYANSNALPGGGVSIREEAVLLTPAATTTLVIVEQTFTLPGLLATDRIAYMTPGSTLGFTAVNTSSQAIALPARTSAISIVAIPYFAGGTAATPPSVTYVFGIAAQRIIP
jgi:hypothetical protein